MLHIPGLYIDIVSKKGRGVFSAINVNPGDVIEICPVIEIPDFEKGILHKTSLHDYYFLWGKNLEKCAIALGYGSLYNHAIFPNANFILDLPNLSITVKCIKPIVPEDEITINYNGTSGDTSKVWFHSVK